MTVKELNKLKEERSECPCSDCEIIVELCNELLCLIDKEAGVDL